MGHRTRLTQAARKSGRGSWCKSRLVRTARMNESCLLLEHGSRALKRHLKVCQRHDIHEVLRLFVMEIALDSSRERTTSIERSFSTGFLYGR